MVRNLNRKAIVRLRPKRYRYGAVRSERLLAPPEAVVSPVMDMGSIVTGVSGEPDVGHAPGHWVVSSQWKCFVLCLAA